MSDPVADLERELRAEAPPGIAALPPEHVAHLATSRRDQRQAQTASRW